MQYQNVYWDVTLVKMDGNYPSILGIGDFWFWYPFPGSSLLNYLGGILATREHQILAFGNNGAEAYDHVNGTYTRQIRTDGQPLRF